jgi:transcriptional regulator with XRE-family HTH domain
MFGLGKPRSKFGKWLDEREIIQNELASKSGLGRTTISNMANNKEYKPKFSTFAKLQRGLKKMGYDIEYHDFWM